MSACQSLIRPKHSFIGKNIYICVCTCALVCTRILSAARPARWRSPCVLRAVPF